MKYLLQKHILWSNFRIWKEGGKKLLDWGKKLSINKSRTMHAHVEILHVQYALWRLTLNLKSRSLVFYPTQGEKTLSIIFQLWWVILIRNHSKKYIPSYSSSIKLYGQFFVQVQKKVEISFLVFSFSTFETVCSNFCEKSDLKKF